MIKKLAYFNIFLGLILIFVGIGYRYKDDFIAFYNEKGTKRYSKEIKFEKQNDYYRDYNFDYVQNTDDSTPNNYQEMLNVLYTAINNGYTEFTFYCGNEYTYCIDDLKQIADDGEELSIINNYVHPFNSFDSVETGYKNDKITIKVHHKYNDKTKELINQRVNEIFDKEIDLNDIQYNSIKKIHDYIINNTKYDSDRTDNGIMNYQSDIAYGPLFEGYAICGGYTDAMQLFLEKLNIKSYRVASNEHIWNAVELNNIWYNLDLTWDDPVIDDGRNILDDTYFMIDTKTLQENDMTEHDFSINYYKELKNT